VATHHCCNRRKIGLAAAGRIEDGRYLAEEVRTEDAGVTMASALASTP
jgi:hypothetical protein